MIAYLGETEDAEETRHLIEQAGRRAILAGGDVADEACCRSLIERAAREFGRLDILVNNAAMQRTYESIKDISAEEWDRTFRYSMFFLCEAAIPHMKPGAAIVNTSPNNAKTPSPTLLAYATTKGAIANFTAGPAQLVAAKGIRVNCVAPGPIWTALIPSTIPQDKVESFGKNVPLGRPASPPNWRPPTCCGASGPASPRSLSSARQASGGSCTPRVRPPASEVVTHYGFLRRVVQRLLDHSGGEGWLRWPPQPASRERRGVRAGLSAGTKPEPPCCSAPRTPAAPACYGPEHVEIAEPLVATFTSAERT